MSNSENVGAVPTGFTSETIATSGADIYCVHGGSGPALVLLHGFPEDWVEYKVIMPRLAKRFTVATIDLPGIGRSSPSNRGYEATAIALQVKEVIKELGLEKAYLVGHDLGGVVAYAFVRQFGDTLRGAMIVDVPIPGLAGWDEATAGFWHLGFIQAPNEIAEKLVVGRQSVFLGMNYDLANFSPEQRAYYIHAYGAEQIHAAFGIYRGFPKDAEWNEAKSDRNDTPVVIAVGEKSFFKPHLQTFIDGYCAKGMTSVTGATIADATHYVVADNPEGVADLIERAA